MAGKSALPLAGHGALVTGGGRGIGAAVARALGDAGAAVMVTARTASEIERVAAELAEHGVKAWAHECDVSVEASVRALGEAARVRLGQIDILVNNAGVSSSAPLHRLSLDEWNRTFAVVATGTFLCTKEFVPDMVERGWGRVVNVASVAGLEGARYVAHYSAAKHAVLGFTRSIALELEGSGVTINAVCPGYVASLMTEATIARVQDRTGQPRESALTAVLASAHQERLVMPAEVADAVVALCRDEAASRNGQAVLLRSGAVR